MDELRNKPCIWAFIVYRSTSSPTEYSGSANDANFASCSLASSISSFCFSREGKIKSPIASLSILGSNGKADSYELQLFGFSEYPHHRTFFPILFHDTVPSTTPQTISFSLHSIWPMLMLLIILSHRS